MRAWPARLPDESDGPTAWYRKLGQWASTERRAVFGVLLFGVLMFLPFLGSLGLWDPWETHYGEVAREMLSRHDLLYPHWEQAYFFSKPALPLWMAAFGMWLTGAEGAPYGEPLGSWTEWGVRLPFAWVAIGCLWAVYRIARQIKGREAGLLAALVLGSSAQFIFIGKQSMVDMPLVGFMTMGLALFIAAVFDETPDAPASPKARRLALGLVLLALLPQVAILLRDLRPNESYDLFQIIVRAGLGIQVLSLAIVAFLGFSLFQLIKTFRRLSRRDTYLIGFYVLMGLAALSKGLAPLAVVGPVVLLYMLIARDFDILKRSGVIWGGFVFLLVAAPWYLALSLFKPVDDGGQTFASRFWMHDNFNRVGVGVHGDRAGLGYYLEQLAYGMFPWVAALPFGLGWAASLQSQSETEGAFSKPRQRALLFVLIWGLWCYAFFTLSQTKFHHYIFPALPAFAVIVGLWLATLAESPKCALSGYTPVLAAVVFIVASRDLTNTPQHLVSLFTYKYDRAYPQELSPRLAISLISVLGGLAAAVFFFLKQRGRAILAFMATGLVFGLWISHVHFNMLTPHWSQYHLFDTYYKQKRADEPIYAYQMNWRGETYYSRNSIIQVKSSGANARMRALAERPGRFFVLTEQSRYNALKNALPRDRQDKLRVLENSNNKFFLCVVDD